MFSGTQECGKHCSWKRPMGDDRQQHCTALRVSQVQATYVTVQLWNKSFHKMTKMYSRQNIPYFSTLIFLNVWNIQAFYEVTDFIVAVRLFILMLWASCGATAVKSQIIIGKQCPQQLFTEINIQSKILTIYETHIIYLQHVLTTLVSQCLQLYSLGTT